MAICQASNAWQQEPAKCEAECGANGIVALKCGQRRTKTVPQCQSEREREEKREGGGKKCG